MSQDFKNQNLEALTDQEVTELGEQLGIKLREILDRACLEANELVKVYGMQAKMQFALEPANKTEELENGRY